MALNKPTPEEKLFAVIQGEPHASLRPRSPAVSLALVRQRLTALVGPLELPRINRFLSMVVVALGVACLIAPLVAQPQLERFVAQASAQSTPFVIAKPLAGVKPLADHSQLLKEKDPFHLESPAGEESAPSGAARPAPRAPQFQEALADLKLVGISWSRDPTVMIEELSTHQTHFLRPGQTVGPFTIKEILQDRVILRAGGQDLELF